MNKNIIIIIITYQVLIRLAILKKKFLNNYEGIIFWGITIYLLQISGKSIYTGELRYDGPSGTRKIGPSYAYDGLSPSYASVYAIALGTSFDRYKSQHSERICLAAVAGLLLYMYSSATRNTRRCEQMLSGRTYLSTSW